MTDKQWKDMLKMLLEILKNEDKEKAIEFIQSLLEK
jgi:formate dehydrogenase maturation protein FdhE